MAIEIARIRLPAHDLHHSLGHEIGVGRRNDVRDRDKAVFVELGFQPDNVESFWHQDWVNGVLRISSSSSRRTQRWWRGSSVERQYSG